MIRMRVFLGLAVFAVAVFFACTNNESEQVGPDSSTSGCEETNSCEQEPTHPNEPGDGYEGYDPCWVGEYYICGGDPPVDPPHPGGSSSSSETVVWFSSSSAYNCAYEPLWCGGIAFDKVKTMSINDSDVGAEEKGQDRPNCIYATEITQIGNESGGIFINGNQFASGSPSRCGGSPTGWGDDTPCATKFANVTKADGGYYIYIPAWAGQNFITTGGTPVCTGSGSGTSSPSQSSSSSAVGGGGICVEPMYGLPPNGVKSCVKKDGKCYTCNPDRGSECEQAWIWQANSIEDYWYVEVDCNEVGGGGGGNTSTITCNGLVAAGISGTAITQPTVRCDNVAVASNALTWAGQPNWNNPTAGSYNVAVGANSGNCSGKTAQCGSITVTAPAASDLTCTGMPQTGTQGTAVAQPTVRCGTATVTSGLTWTGAPSWANPNAGTYSVSVRAGSGTCSGKTATCGTLTVSPKLTCGAMTPASPTVVAGTAVTPPTVTCGSAAVASGSITWTGAPTLWSAPTQGTYNNIQARATSGACNGATANCPGTLTVTPKLTCNSVTQAITTGNRPTLPAVTCGSTAVTSGITWSPTSITGAINTAQTIGNVTARATSGTCNGQTATCPGTITVTAQTTTPSSSSVSGGTSSSGSGGGSYTPTAPGTSSAKTTQYWDACKPSCSWGGKGGKQANSCNITGINIGHNDSDKSSCDGGNAFTCMNQAPWKVGNVSFGYAAINMGACGDCYQLDFPNGHVMVVMKSNIGNLNEGAAFDLMIPGGGVGDFDALTRQVTNSGVSNPDMGNRYGGFRVACNNSVSCVKQKCDATFKNLPDMKAGCNWYADNLGADRASFDNPTVKYKLVTCPKELTDKF